MAVNRSPSLAKRLSSDRVYRLKLGSIGFSSLEEEPQAVLGAPGTTGAAERTKSLSALDSSELQELGLLYRQTASDLSVVLEDKTSVQLAAYLNQLLGRSHNLLYMGRSPKSSAIWRFYSQTYPRLFRETWRSTLLATVVFAAAAVAAGR